jgi:hypothetical protein
VSNRLQLPRRLANPFVVVVERREQIINDGETADWIRCCQEHTTDRPLNMAGQDMRLISGVD